MSPSPIPPAERPSDRILARLMALHPKVIDLTLERMERLAARLGHPERRLPQVIHVAGTNGKGSVVQYVRAILEAGGAAVHAYTSPHLVRFHERIRLAEGPGRSALIEEGALSALLDECERANGAEPITFFEITTTAAFLAFSRAQADWLALEVGLGGRLDATNMVARPAASVITPVNLDHQQFLGESIEEIAFEKAGILKPGVPAVIGPQSEPARETIEARAAEIGAPLILHGREFTAWEEHGRLAFQDPSGLLDLPRPRLPGRHQIDNAAIAIAALRAAGADPSEAAIEAGLQAAEWRGRLQRLSTGPVIAAAGGEAEIWLDGGHNPAAAEAVAAAMHDLQERKPRPLHLIAGLLNTKDARGFFEPFRGLARSVIGVSIPGETNTLSANAIARAAAEAGLPAISAESAAEAAALIAADRAEGTPPPRILICGSLYLAGQILRDHG